MRITLVTPASPRSRAGNRATATRWAAMLRQLGHRVTVVTSDAGRDSAERRADLLLALHAWRSAEAIAAARAHAPARPLAVALTGTDIYRFQHNEPEATVGSMAAADILIGLHGRVADDIPERFHGKLYTVLQSAEPLPPSYPGPPTGQFRVCVAGHLREEKDSLRAAYAVRDLPEASRIHVTAAGRAHDDEWARAATSEAGTNPRYDWRGEIAHWRVRRLMAGSHAMVMSSVMEGGANVVSEACVAGLPVLASDIPGNRGLLGEDYPGYYPVRDTVALQQLLLRAERDPHFLGLLRRHCRAVAPRLAPEAEQASLATAVEAAVTG
jgi:putative glycosyltransferase (TIGR04348 family)